MLVRRTEYELSEAEERAHILEGLKIALDNIDAVIALIRGSADPEVARKGLMKSFSLSERQAKAILDMRLQRLTSLEVEKIVDEYREMIKQIERLKNILANRALRMAMIKEELGDIRERYGDERRTEIIHEATDFSVEDMIAEEDMVITISHNGYIKRSPSSQWRRQRRGARC